MYVANRHRQCICGIVGRRHSVQAEKQFDHLLDLTLVSTAVPHDGPFHFRRRVLEHFATGLHRGENRDTTRMTELERATRIARVEHVFDDNALRLTLGEMRSELAVDSGQSAGKGVSCGGGNRTAGD